MSRRLPAGMTLVEAVVGTALLGTVLVSVLMANSRLTAQDGRSRRRIEACKIADEFLESWWPRKAELPRSGSGPIGGRGGWTWRTRTVESPSAGKIGAEVVALEVFSPSDKGRLPLARMEILLPKDETDTFDRPDLD